MRLLLDRGGRAEPARSVLRRRATAYTGGQPIAIVALVPGSRGRSVGNARSELAFPLQGAWFSAASVSFRRVLLAAATAAVDWPRWLPTVGRDARMQRGSLHDLGRWRWFNSGMRPGTQAMPQRRHRRPSWRSPVWRSVGCLCQGGRSSAGRAADLLEGPVAFMVQPGVDYVSVLWGIWRAGGIAVPLCPEHPAPELEHVIRDSGARTVVFDALFEERVGTAAEATEASLLSTKEAKRGGGRGRRRLPDVEPFRRALILYTSGTTGRPKGVVSTHGSLTSQIESAGRGVGLGRRGSDPPRPAAPSHARDRERAALRPVDRRYLRDAAALRRRADLAAPRLGRDHPLHGGADDLRPPDPGLGGRRPERREDAVAGRRAACA